MSKISLAGNASGTGTFTIASPNGNTDRTLSLPDSSGTVATAESTLAQFNATGSAPVYAARAWVNFNGTGTVAIRASGNVSSITDNGVGDYTVNFTTAMPDVNFCGCGVAKDQNYIDMQIPSPSASYAVVRNRLDNSALTDGQVNIAVFR